MLLEGLYIPLTTPFHPDGLLNLPKLASNIARYSKTPAAGLMVLGPTGEPALLSDDETRQTLRAAALAAAPEKVLIAGISRDSVRATLALAEFAATLDYDAVLVGTPAVLTGPDCLREALTYFQTVADRSPLPLILLNTAAHPISTEAIAELAAHPNILGLLDGAAEPAAIAALLTETATIRHEATVTPIFTAVTARMLRAAATASRPTLLSAASLTSTATATAEPPPIPTLKTRAKTVGFQIIASAPAHLLDSLNAGAVAIAPAFAACAPQACYEIFAAWKDADQPLAHEKQARIREAALLAEETPGALKFGCDLNGYFGGWPRLPLLPPNAAQRGELERLMHPMRN
jgi:dihydrodipicolinate synthase/N-acetylneuraminate lyase